MKEITFNLNESVKVKLKDLGISILKKQRDELNEWIKSRGGKGLEDYEPRVDEAGYTTFQMWQFIETFGPYIGPGKDSPFHLDIKILTKG